MLKIDHLRKTYNTFSLDCSLEVKPGCVTGFIGQNGAGKSTTFKAALGLVKPEGGTVRILGKDIRECSARDREELGVVLSDSGFSGYLTVRDIFSILSGLYSKFDKAFFQDQIRKSGLPDNKKIKEFSTGMKAKLKVITAISHRAGMLILDEPTAGLDVVARDEILELLRDYMEQQEDRAILISSHISGDLEGLCDDIYMIHEGRIILHEDTDVLLSDYALIKAVKTVKRLRRYISSAFIIDSTHMMCRSGQISRKVQVMCDALLLHPIIVLRNSRMAVGSLEMGSFNHVIKGYVRKVLANARNIDKRILFITYAGMDEKSLQYIQDLVRQYCPFERVYLQKASSAIASNCGPGSFGLLFMKKTDVAISFSEASK